MRYAVAAEPGVQVHRFDSVRTPAAVPEPASWALLMLGFATVGGALRGARRSRAVRQAV